MEYETGLSKYNRNQIIFYNFPEYKRVVIVKF